MQRAILSGQVHAVKIMQHFLLTYIANKDARVATGLVSMAHKTFLTKSQEDYDTHISLLRKTIPDKANLATSLEWAHTRNQLSRESGTRHFEQLEESSQLLIEVAKERLK